MSRITIPLSHHHPEPQNLAELEEKLVRNDPTDARDLLIIVRALRALERRLDARDSYEQEQGEG